MAAGAGLASLALLTAGCDGSGSPHVAKLGATTVATPSAPVSAAQNGQIVGSATEGLEYSACMRRHGVTSFPDPSHGAIHLVGGGIDPNSATFKSAQSSCQKLSPKGGQPTAAQQAQQLQRLLALSRCMRAHGIEDFPDPRGGRFQLTGGPGSDLNPNNPRFQRAESACGRGHVSFGKGTVRIG